VGRPNIGDRDHFLQFADEILKRRWLTNDGEVVRSLEKEICKLLDVRHCIAMCNGTIALEIAIRALGLKGEVIVPAWTFIATAHALYWQGITPVFADIDPATQNLDPVSVREKISPQTSGIIGVHLWGRPAPIQELQALADEYGIKLMFDAAHAIGCTYNGQHIGKFGACEVLSFHATKVFNTFEGGAVVTDDDELAEAMRLMRNFGFAGYDNVVYPGTNGKLTEVCAAMGLVNLNSLQNFIECNRQRYEAYLGALNGVEGLKLISPCGTSTPNYHYVVLVLDQQLAGQRDELIKTLHAENVLARKYFWPGCHRMLPYREGAPWEATNVPNTDDIARRVLVLPTGSAVRLDDIFTIAEIIKCYLAN